MKCFFYEGEVASDPLSFCPTPITKVNLFFCSRLFWPKLFPINVAREKRENTVYPI